jgi:tartrate-resistant acid phosphatase type 5
VKPVHNKKQVYTYVLTIIFGINLGASLSCSTAQTNPVLRQESDERSDTVVRMAVIGDFGASSEAEMSVANLINGWNPDLILTLGDNNYPDGTAATIDQNIGQFYSEYIVPYTGLYRDPQASESESGRENRFFPALGNHDWRTGNCEAYLDYFTLPGNERYYQIRRGSVEVFVIDSDPHEPDGNTAESLQAAWLQAQMAASDATFKIVTMHHPPYSSGPHGENISSQWPFAEWGADAIIGGHDHIYERIVLDGVPYIVNGVGGSWLYEFEQILTGSQVRYNSSFGALLIEATGSTLTLQMITTDGGIVDTLNIPAVGKLNEKGPAIINSSAVWTEETQPSLSHTRRTHTFRAEPHQTVGNLIAEVQATDGFIISINDVEVWRQNLPSGATDQQTRALAMVSPPVSTVQNTISATPLQVGENIVTVDLFTANDQEAPPHIELQLFEPKALNVEP